MMITRFLVIASLLFLAKACEEEAQISFSETNILHEESSVVEINIPKAEGQSEIAKNIQAVIESHIANQLNFSEEPDPSVDIETGISKFESEYNAFKSDIAEDAMPWEAIFDGDVIYKSSEVISIAVNSYLNTGGAHGNMNVTLFNFSATNGEQLKTDDLLIINPAFLALAERHFNEEISQKGGDPEEYFFDEGFSLPANMGLNDDGLLLFYNNYEIAAYAMGITEFTIPYDEADPFLKLF